MTPLDPYSVLGVASAAGESELKSAYRARARLLHPDMNRDARGCAPQAAHDAFAQVCDAYRLALRDLSSGGPSRTQESPRPVPDGTRRQVAPAAAGGAWLEALVVAGLAILGWWALTDLVPAVMLQSTR